MKQELIEKTISRNRNRYTFIYNKYVQNIFLEQGEFIEDEIDSISHYFNDTIILKKYKCNNGLRMVLFFKEVNYILNFKINILNEFGDLCASYSVRRNKFIYYKYNSCHRELDIFTVIQFLTKNIDLKIKLEEKLPIKNNKIKGMKI